MYELIKLARKENIHLITCPLHTIHWLQLLDKEEELERKKARDATKAKKKEQGETQKVERERLIWVTYVLYVVHQRVGNGSNVTHVNGGCIRNMYLKL